MKSINKNTTYDLECNLLASKCKNKCHFYDKEKVQYYKKLKC